MDTYTAQIAWYMQRNYQAQKKARTEDHHLLWSLFDCSFHVHVVRHLRTCWDARCWQDHESKKIKVRYKRGETHHLRNEWSPPVSCLLHPVANVMLLQGNLERRRSRKLYLMASPLSSSHPLHKLLSRARRVSSDSWEHSIQKNWENTKQCVISHFQTTSVSFF